MLVERTWIIKKKIRWRFLFKDIKLLFKLTQYYYCDPHLLRMQNHPFEILLQQTWLFVARILRCIIKSYWKSEVINISAECMPKNNIDSVQYMQWKINRQHKMHTAGKNIDSAQYTLQKINWQREIHTAKKKIHNAQCILWKSTNICI